MQYDNENAPWIHIKQPNHIVFKSGITSIAKAGFEFSVEGNTGHRKNYYDRIKTVKLPNTIKKINSYAFANCNKLNEINIPKSVKSIGDSAFEDCKKNKDN